MDIYFFSRCIWDIVKKIKIIHFKFVGGDRFWKCALFLKKIKIQKISDRHERNFEVCVVIIGGICVLNINNLADKL